MLLNINRFLSDRLVWAPTAELRVAKSFWDWCKRIISWIWSPSSYSDENRRTITCFKRYLIDTLGADRLQRICTRYSLDLNKMEAKGSPLLSRDVAKIVIGAQNVSVEDVNNFQELDSATLARAVANLSRPFGDRFTVPNITKELSGRPTDWTSRLSYDPFLADRERLQVSRENPTDSFDVFIHNMVAPSDQARNGCGDSRSRSEPSRWKSSVLLCFRQSDHRGGDGQLYFTPSHCRYESRADPPFPRNLCAQQRYRRHFHSDHRPRKRSRQICL